MELRKYGEILVLGLEQTSKLPANASNDLRRFLTGSYFFNSGYEIPGLPLKFSKFNTGASRADSKNLPCSTS